MIVSGVICDKCKNYHLYGHTGAVRTAKWAREDGWSIGKQTLCPYCRKKRKERTYEKKFNRICYIVGIALLWLGLVAGIGLGDTAIICGAGFMLVLDRFDRKERTDEHC